MFEPSDEGRLNAPSALGYFDENGAYELVSAGMQKGAPIGNYRVIVMEGAPNSLSDEGAAANMVNSKIPSRYKDYDAGLNAKVEAGDQVIDFPLTTE